MDMYKKATVLTTSQPTQPPNGSTNPSIAPLITMIAVLAIILIFCFCGAPAVRSFCRRKVCVCWPEPEGEAGTPSERGGSSTPTIILLPFGRMLVVDHSVFAHFQADETGLDFMELSANLIRNHRLQLAASTPSILDSGASSKGLSPISLGCSPPAYEDIVRLDLPPSYSELSLLFRQQQEHRDSCCIQVTASLNDVFAAAASRDCCPFRALALRDHVTTSVLRVVDERASSTCSPNAQRTESETNIHQKYRVLSKQTSF